jgi:two-component system, response regulator
MSDKFILLVEDNPDDVVLTQMALRKCRIPNEVTVVWNGEEALDFLFSRGKYVDRDHDQNPVLILLDLKIPCLSGLEVLKQIRANEKTCSIPVVILTSSVEENDREESIHLGADSFYIKPVIFDEFIGLIQRLNSEWLDLKDCLPEKRDLNS